MSSKEQQSTDPSTPNALRARAPTDPTPTPPPVSAYTSTEPGVGPEARTRTLSTPPGQRTPPMGLVVPAASKVKTNKNSVELLLEGMQGPQPERPKTTPQTDGQASASYHAEHGVRPARTSPDEEPKVVVERAPLIPTTRIDRVRLQSAVDHANTLRRAMEPPVAIPQQMAPRLVAAVVAGMTVVVGLFLVLRLAMGGREAPRPPVGSPPGTPARVAPPPSAAPAPPPAVAPEPPVAAASPATPTPMNGAARATAIPPAAPASARPRNPRAAPSSAADLGEFKTIFH